MPHSDARVGIVIRTKNRPWFLRRALSDVAAQNYPGWFAQIVNDGGDPEDVDRIVASLAPAMRPRVGVIHNAQPVGRSAAANQGIRALESEFVVLHDDDDLWHPEFLERTVAHLDAKSGDIGVVVRTEIVHEVEDGAGGFAPTVREVFWADLHEITYTDLLRINRWVPIAYLYRRLLHDRVGFYDEDIHAAEDWDLGLRTLVRHEIGFIDGEPLAFWMQRPAASGEIGNSMFTLADDHDRYDRLIRDAAIRDYSAANGPGLALYLARFIPNEVTRIVREEVARQFEHNPSDMDRVRRRLRRLFGKGRDA